MLIVRSGLLTATNWAAEGSKYPYAFQETTLIFDSLLDSGFNSCSPVITLSATQLSNSNDTILFGIATNKEAKGVLLFVVRGSGSGSSLVSILFQVDSVAEGFRKALKTRCPCLRCITGISLRHAKQAPKQPASLTLPNIRVLDLDRGSISQPLDATPHLRTQPRARSSGGIKALASQASNLLRFVFGVNEIKSTATSIRTMISAGLTCGEKHVDKLSPMIVKKLEKFEVTLGRSFGVSGNASSIPERPHRPSISKANRTSSYSVPSPLPDKIAPCINPINAATTNVLVFLLQTLRSTNLFSINDIIAGLVFLVGSLLLAVCQKARVIVRSKLTKFGRVLLESLRGALFTPIASWRIVGILPRKWGWTVRPVDAVAFILAFLVNLASYLVEGTAPTRIAAFNYKASLDSDLKDSVSTAAFTDIKDYLGISINTIKALQVPTDIFAEPEIPVFGLGELILRIIILTIQFPRNKDVPGYTKRVAFFACWASETITYHFLLILNLGHVLISSRTLAAIQLIISVLGFSLAASMHWADLQALGKEGLAHARMMIYLSFSSCLLGSIGGFAAKAGIILPYPSSRTTCAVVVAVANKANGVVQTTLKVHRKYKAA